jgi:hypothetical protein
MKHALVLVLTVAASPLLAHDGLHMHPHANDPAWVPVIIGLAVVGLAIGLRRRFK